jgi:hypothetical protein
MKTRPVGAELFRADCHTDTTTLIVACRNFVNAPKNENRTATEISKFKLFVSAWQSTNLYVCCIVLIILPVT